LEAALRPISATMATPIPPKMMTFFFFMTVSQC
jgi:hypothetical protein